MLEYCLCKVESNLTQPSQFLHSMICRYFKTLNSGSLSSELKIEYADPEEDGLVDLSKGKDCT